MHILRVGITARYKNTRSVAPPQMLHGQSSLSKVQGGFVQHTGSRCLRHHTPHTLPFSRGGGHRCKMLTAPMLR